MKKKPKPVAAQPNVRVEKFDAADLVEVSMYLADMIGDGWLITTCAAVRADGYNRDTLFYTLIRAA